MPGIALQRYRGLWVGLEIVVPGRVLRTAPVVPTNESRVTIRITNPAPRVSIASGMDVEGRGAFDARRRRGAPGLVVLTVPERPE